MEPSFKYIKNPDQGNPESVSVETQSTEEQAKAAAKQTKRSAHKHGSSLGWGWFQGFNLFVTGCFLLICLGFAYFMMGSETHHEGPPKYAVDQTNTLGKAIFNPALPEEVRESFVYHPPVRRPKNEEKPVLEEIELISEAAQTQQPDLPTLSLVSASEEDDAPEAINLPGLQLEAHAETAPTTTETTNPQVSHLLKQAAGAMSRGHLSEPYPDSALALYRRALELEPSNGDALAGIDRLATHYLNLAKKAWAREDYFSALDYADLGLKADPLNPELNQLKAYLINQ